jgi:hypothetical protein
MSPPALDARNWIVTFVGAARMLQIAKNLTDKPPRVPLVHECRGIYIKR